MRSPWDRHISCLRLASIFSLPVVPWKVLQYLSCNNISIEHVHLNARFWRCMLSGSLHTPHSRPFSYNYFLCLSIKLWKRYICTYPPSKTFPAPQCDTPLPAAFLFLAFFHGLPLTIQPMKLIKWILVFDAQTGEMIHQTLSGFSKCRYPPTIDQDVLFILRH